MANIDCIILLYLSFDQIVNRNKIKLNILKSSNKRLKCSIGVPVEY